MPCHYSFAIFSIWTLRLYSGGISRRLGPWQAPIFNSGREGGKGKNSEIERTITASNDAFISESHQKALATDGDDINSVATRLTKDDDAPPAAKVDDLSTLTGET